MAWSWRAASTALAALAFAYLALAAFGLPAVWGECSACGTVLESPVQPESAFYPKSKADCKPAHLGMALGAPCPVCRVAPTVPRLALKCNLLTSAPGINAAYLGPLGTSLVHGITNMNPNRSSRTSLELPAGAGPSPQLEKMQRRKCPVPCRGKQLKKRAFPLHERGIIPSCPPALFKAAWLAGRLRTRQSCPEPDRKTLMLLKPPKRGGAFVPRLSAAAREGCYGQSGCSRSRGCRKRRGHLQDAVTSSSGVAGRHAFQSPRPRSALRNSRYCSCSTSWGLKQLSEKVCNSKA